MNGEGSSSFRPVMSDRNLPRANTMPGGKKREETEIWSGPQNLERSNTEKRRQNNSRFDPAVQLFDEKISDRKKLKMLNRLATMKGAGTVEVEVPGDIEHATLDFSADYAVAGAADEEPMELTDVPYVPPLQIAILIVGTTGDVQPFISIGKRLQLSYQIVDSMIWLGIPDMINQFRKKKLKLRPVTYLSSVQGSSSDIPHGYIWSPHLVAKPKDWGPKIDVVGFCFLDLASTYQPPESLVKWIEAGEKPIYIGFPSLPVQEPEKMTKIIVEALEITGQRGIINKGWGGLGNLAEPKDFVYLLDNVPHDWLFLQCKAVVRPLHLYANLCRKIFS